MPFGVVSGVGRGMGVLDGGDHRRGRGTLGDKCGVWTSHLSNGILLSSCARAMRSSQIILGGLVSSFYGQKLKMMTIVSITQNGVPVLYLKALLKVEMVSV